ncbi:MAG: hypothetical protein QOG23_3449 [Blastocatellia bacterium]|jgi:hypothetical protein|nr:hypothetical protein [Blastocatellia bacterium]
MRKLTILFMLFAAAAVALAQGPPKPSPLSLTPKRLLKNLRPWRVRGKVRSWAYRSTSQFAPHPAAP